MSYLRRTYRVDAEVEELVAAELWDQGTLGLEMLASAGGKTLLAAYFDVPGAPAAWQGEGARLVAEEPVAEEDWLARYRELAQPLEIGKRLVIDPREPGSAAPTLPAGRTLLRVPARTAFGTGSHASTRLALLLLESLPVTGSRVLDVGTGSGILSLAACRFGASQTFGFDLDSGAVLVARQIARLNASPEAHFFAGAISALSPSALFDVALVNAMPHQVASELPEIVQRVRPGGALVVSGFLAADGLAVLAAWQEQGARVRRRLEEGEWGAALLDRDSR